MVIITFLCSVYYNVIMAWTFYYMFASFRKTLPWEECEPSWSDDVCKYVEAQWCYKFYAITVLHEIEWFIVVCLNCCYCCHCCCFSFSFFFLFRFFIGYSIRTSGFRSAKQCSSQRLSDFVQINKMPINLQG